MGNALPTQMRDQFKALSPPFLSEGFAEKFGYVMGVVSDLLLERAFQAQTIRIPGLGDPSQIPWLANDRLLIQGPKEPDAAFILRLTKAFETWKRAGSRRAILEQLQAYMQGLQPGVAANLPEMTIVGGDATLISTWSTLTQGDPLGAVPSLQRIVPGNFDWDGTAKPWRSFLILYMALVPTGQSGAAASWSAGTQYPGGTGQNVAGVWVPNPGGSVPGSPLVNINGLSGIVAGNLGQWITTTGGSVSTHRGTFQITAVNSPTSVQVSAPPFNVAPDAGPYGWSIGSYPWIGPGPVFGQPGIAFGDGISPTLPIDLGENSQGTWKPRNGSIAATSRSLGLNVPPTLMTSLRTILKRWKSAGAYYPHIIVAFDGGDSTSGFAYSPNSTPGSGNPDGTFGPVGENVTGTWVPARLIQSTYDCYCDGTGSYSSCSVQNVT